MEGFISILNSQAAENMMKYSIEKKEKIKNFELKKHTIQVGRTTHVSFYDENLVKMMKNTPTMNVDATYKANIRLDNKKTQLLTIMSDYNGQVCLQFSLYKYVNYKIDLLWLR